MITGTRTPCVRVTGRHDVLFWSMQLSKAMLSDCARVQAGLAPVSPSTKDAKLRLCLSHHTSEQPKMFTVKRIYSGVFLSLFSAEGRCPHTLRVLTTQGPVASAMTGIER